MGNAMVWLWRLVTTAILAIGVWGIYWQALQLEILNAQVVELVDYISFIVEPTE